MQGRNAIDKTGYYRVMDNRIKFRDNYKLFNTNFSYKKKKILERSCYIRGYKEFV